MPLCKILLVVIVLSLFSCKVDRNRNLGQIKKDETKVSSNSCLEKYAMNPCLLIDLKKIAELAGIEASVLEEKQPLNQLKKRSLRMCKYSWPKRNAKKLKGTSENVELEIANDILVGMFNILDSEKSRIKAPYSDWFKNSHRPMTEEEMKSLRESASKKLEESADADADVGKLLLNGILEIGKKDVYIEVEGLGDLASARVSGTSPDIYLDILHRNLTFRIVVNF